MWKEQRQEDQIWVQRRCGQQPRDHGESLPTSINRIVLDSIIHLVQEKLKTWYPKQMEDISHTHTSRHRSLDSGHWGHSSRMWTAKSKQKFIKRVANTEDSNSQIFLFFLVSLVIMEDITFSPLLYVCNYLPLLFYVFINNLVLCLAENGWREEAVSGGRLTQCRHTLLYSVKRM